MDYSVYDLFWNIINFSEFWTLKGESSASIPWTFRICARSPDNLSEIYWPPLASPPPKGDFFKVVPRSY